MKLLKTTYPTQQAWEAVKKLLYKKQDEEIPEPIEQPKELLDGIIEIMELNHLQKKMADGTWGYDTDWAVDILIEDNFDYSVIEPYLAPCPAEKHRITGGKYEIICK